MRRIAIPLFCAMILLASLFAVVQAATLDCGSRTVSAGESRVDVLMACGEPDTKESRQEELIDKGDGSLKQKTIIIVEEWTYNFGPSQFMRIVTLRNGKVADIRVGDYGSSKSNKPEKPEFSDRIVSLGDSMSDVTMKWGEPTWKDTRQEEFKEKLGIGQERKTIVTTEEWTYNFGTNRFVRILTFKNSNLVDIRTGGYGYDKRQ